MPVFNDELIFPSTSQGYWITHRPIRHINFSEDVDEVPICLLPSLNFESESFNEFQGRVGLQLGMFQISSTLMIIS